MVALPRFRIVSLMLVGFLGFYMLAPLSNIRPAAHAADPPAPPLPVAEDPLGQQPEQSIPEININVDARDGHLTVRVVDIWGPGRTPLVVRSYTNAVMNPDVFPLTPSYGWSFAHALDIVVHPFDPNTLHVLEPDGNRAAYKLSAEWFSQDHREKWQEFTKSIGVVSKIQKHFVDCAFDPNSPSGGSSVPTRPARPAPRVTPAVPPAAPGIAPLSSWECVWDGLHTAFLPKGVVRVYSGNYLLTETDANGNITTFTWTGFGDGVGTYLSQVRDPVGRTITYTYEHAYQVCVSWHDDICTQYKWVYRVQRVTDPYGRSATYGYAAPDLPISSVVHPTGRTTNYFYTSLLLSAVQNARGYTTAMTWQFNQAPGTNTPRVTHVTPPGSPATTYSYTLSTLDPSRVKQSIVTDARGNRTIYDLYDGTDQTQVGNVTKATDPLGRFTQFVYDARYNTTQITDARGVVTKYEYNTRNNVTRIIRAFGTLNLTTQAEWDDFDNLKAVVDPRNIRTEYLYDAAHNLTKISRAVSTPDISITQYTYYPWGGVEKLIDWRGSTTTYFYTARRQIQRIVPPAGGQITFAYDAPDDQTSLTDGNGHTWSKTYFISRLVDRETDPLGHFTRNEYDENGNRTKIWDARNKPTQFVYDTRDRLITITDPYLKQTTYTYDHVSNLKTITNARSATTEFFYEANNRLHQVKDPMGQWTTYLYDDVGNRRQMTDRKQQVQTYGYDDANRLTTVSAPQISIAYTYDAAGNRKTMTDATGLTRYDYDSINRLTKTTYPDGKTVVAGYDPAGNRTTFVNPGNNMIQLQYDSANRLWKITQSPRTWIFTYDQAGNRETLTAPNGTSTVYEYFNNNWLKKITHKAPGGAVFQTISYTYDPNGNRRSQTDSSGTTDFNYDDLNRLTRAIHPGTYGTWTWEYDWVGNRTRQTGGAGPINYTYDLNNRLLTAGSTTYAHDPNGNLTSNGTTTFTYDALNRLTRAQTGVGSIGSTTYTYNGDGLKVTRVAAGTTVTKYYYDGIWPIWESDGGGAMAAELERDIFGNLMARREPSGARYYIHPDGLGSLTAVTDATGAVAATMLYDAWGNQRASTGTAHGNYRFTGAELDSRTGMYHMGARFYDPTIGRWLAEDPAAFQSFDPSSLNFYAYAGGNPVRYVDPHGTEEFDPGQAGAQKKASEIVNRMARALGMTPEELLELISQFRSWAAVNAAGLGTAGTILAGVAAVLGIIAAATAGAPLTLAAIGTIATVAAVTGIIGSIAGTLSAYGKMVSGQIGTGAFLAIAGATWAGVAGPGPAAIGSIAAQKAPYTGRQALVIVGHLARTGAGVTGVLALGMNGLIGLLWRR